MSFALRKVSQLAFAVLFLILLVMGRIQLWMGIFLVSATAALMLGRFYCGWMCPINTLTEVIDWCCKKLHIQRRSTPRWLKASFVGDGILLLFLSTTVFVLATGKRLPVLPALAVLGAALSLIFQSSTWHRHLCPFGRMLRLTAGRAKHGWTVREEECINCGICKKVCSGDAVQMEDGKGKPHIESSLCLSCTACAVACPKDAIVYKSI